PNGPPGVRNRPITNIAAPTAVTTMPPISRRLELIAANPTSGRIAATGGTLAARRAGKITLAIVTPTPTISDTITAAGLSTSEDDGKPAPLALNTEMISLATPNPARRPWNVAAN